MPPNMMCTPCSKQLQITVPVKAKLDGARAGAILGATNDTTSGTVMTTMKISLIDRGWPFIMQVQKACLDRQKGASVKYLFLSSAMFLAVLSGVSAEETKLGNPQGGLTYAKQACSACHGISNEKSPVPEAHGLRR
jgi:mono/diheme cytochrome c family protein